MRQLTEWQIVQAYIRLFLTPEEDGGSRFVSLARIGTYEVRLCDPSIDVSGDVFTLWLELYARESRCVIDSYGCHEFEEAVIAADELVAQARRLHRQSIRE